MGFHVLRAAGDDLLDADCLVAFGDNPMRLQRSRELEAAGRRLVTVPRPSAVISRHATVGTGCFIGEFSYVGPRARIGVGTIVNTGALVEHDCVIGNGCHISVDVTIAGGCWLADEVTIFSGATLRNRVSISADVVVGAGAVVCEDLTAPGTYVGIPARLMKQLA